MLERAPARVARPLREVHDLRDRLPGLQRHAALRRARSTPGPQAERYRVADEPSVDASVDYCSGCGICTQVCPQGVHIAEINAQARDKLKRQKGVPLRDRIIARPTWLGRAGTPGAPRSPTGRSTTAPLRILGEKLLEGPPRRAGARLRRADASQRWARKHERPRAGAQGRLLPRLRHRATTSPTEGEKTRRASSSTTASRSRSPSRTAAGCRCSPAASSTTRARYVLRLARNLAPHVRDERHDHRRQRRRAAR